MTPDIWKISPSVPVLDRSEPRSHGIAANDNAMPPDLTRLKSALDAIPNSGKDELDYDAWRNVVFGVHDATDGSDAGYELALEFSERASKFDREFFDTRVWPHVRSERQGNVITAGTVYHLARQAGWIDPDAPDPQDTSDFACEEDTQHGAPATLSGAPAKAPIAAALDRVYQAAAFGGLAPLSWIVKRVLPRADIGVVFGATSSGKTFFVLDLALSIARGLPEWRGHKVRQGRVLYLAAEGAGGLRLRLNAYAAEHELDLGGVDFHVMPSSPNLTDPKRLANVIAEAYKAGPFALVIIDTLAQVAAGADENSAQDMGLLMTHCRQLGRALGAMVLLVHHSGKHAEKGARGSSAIKGALDVEIELVRVGEDRSARVSKMRDGQDQGKDLEFGFRLKPVEVGTDEDGDPRTSCVLAYTKSVATDTRLQPPTGDRQQAIWDALPKLMGLEGGLPGRDQVIEYVARGAGPNPPKNLRSNLRASLNALINQGKVVGVNGGLRRRQLSDE